MLEIEGRRYKLRWSGKGDRLSGVGATEKEELCEKVIGVRRVSDRAMNVVVIEKDVLR